MTKVKISASIIATDLRNIEKTVKQLERAGVNFIHIDTMDGHFFDYIGLGPHVIKAVKQSSKTPVEVHLAVLDVERLLKIFLETGVNLISVQLEVCKFPLRVIRRIKSRGIRAGVALLPSTPLIQIADLIDYVDEILLLSNNDSAFIHWEDSEFLPETLDRIRELKRIIGPRKIEIAVDGGLRPELLNDLIKAGATVLVMGRSIFEGDIEENVRKIKEIIEEAVG